MKRHRSLPLARSLSLSIDSSKSERKVRRGSDVFGGNLQVKGHSSSDGIPYNGNIAENDKINECPRQSSSSSSQSIKKDQTAVVSGSEHSESSSLDTNSRTQCTDMDLLCVVSVLKHRHDKLASFVASELNQNNPPSKCRTKCKLLDWVDSNKIVAEGEITVEDPTYHVKGIGTPLGRGNEKTTWWMEMEVKCEAFEVAALTSHSIGNLNFNSLAAKDPTILKLSHIEPYVERSSPLFSTTFTKLEPGPCLRETLLEFFFLLGV
ncbi:hypothetical protein Sjap_003711 [Stephania japonica]|uniref:Uncharacterized protein n=1 Tax=Stephania japonica TaxID=461633 RepID=A0AAP0KPC6_9MAGN